MIEGVKAMWLGSSPTPDHRRSVERIFAQMELPKVLVAAMDLLADADGGIWVGEYSMFGMPAKSWHVFDADGGWSGCCPGSAGLSGHAGRRGSRPGRVTRRV